MFLEMRKIVKFNTVILISQDLNMLIDTTGVIYIRDPP